MEYKIIKISGCPTTDYLDMELEDKVNEYIDKGWRPFGSICIVKVGILEDCKNDVVEVWQPMIKEINNE